MTLSAFPTAVDAATAAADAAAARIDCWLLPPAGMAAAAPIVAVAAAASQAEVSDTLGC